MASPFEVGRSIGTNLSQARREAKDENSIQRILAEASKNPQDMQNAIGKILSQVSPERQQMAIAYLQGEASRVKEKETLRRQQAAAEKYGYPADAPPGVQKTIMEGKMADERAANIFGGGQLGGGQGQPATGVPSAQPAGQPGGVPGIPTGGKPISLNDLSNEQLIALTGVKGYSEPAKALLKQRQEEEKQTRADIRQSRQESADYKKELAFKADNARIGIENKKNLMEIIDRGNLDDPTYAAIAINLPYNLGERMLSDDTAEYRAATVEEFKDLRNIFKGQTRVAELEILEKKIADVYLTDSQKKAILKSRMKALEADVLNADAAAEIEAEFPNIGILAFQKKVAERQQEKKKALFGAVLDEQKAILSEAESRKGRKLDRRNPEDMEIAEQIIKEAGGSRAKARELAKDKGYVF